MPASWKTVITVLALLSVLPLAAAEAPLAQEGDLGAREYVLLATSDGDILLELYPERAPKTVENFLKYVDSGFYDKTAFHRIVRNHVVQGGGYTIDFSEKVTREPVRNESIDARLRNFPGTVAMARGANPHSATSQFYINLKNNTHLDWDGPNGGFAVFGKVVKGMDEVVRDIELVPTGPGPEDAEVMLESEVPFRPVYIIKASRIPAEDAAAMLAPTDEESTQQGSEETKEPAEEAGKQ